MNIPTPMAMDNESASLHGTAPASDLGFLSALQLADTFFPTGLYTLSHGLEAFVQHNLVTSGQDVEALLLTYLEQVVGPSDGIAVSHAHQATLEEDIASLIGVDRRLTAVKLSREGRDASGRLGKQVMVTAMRIAPQTILDAYQRTIATKDAPGNATVVFAAVAASLGIPRREAILVLLYTFSTSLLGAAMRLIRFDHVQAQAILTRIRPLLIRIVEADLNSPLDAMRSFAPMIDIMAMRHERSTVRLFIT